MQPEQDAYGHAIRDYYADGEAFELVERDDGWIAPSGGPEQYFRAYEDWPPRQQVAMDHVEGRVLDIGCGAGRHSLYLQERGHEVVGIDVSPNAVQVCRNRGLTDVRELDIQSLSELEGSFDTIVMLGNNFGLIGTRETAPTRLEALADIAAPGATLLAESRDPYDTDDPDHLAYHDRNEERGRLGGALRIRVRYRRHATPWFDYLLASPGEMASILEGSPWRLGQRIDDPEESAEYVGVLTVD